MNFRYLKLKLIALFVRIYGKERWIKRAYLNFFKKKLNLEQPVTFNEKLQWLKLNDKLIENTKFADKFFVREYIEDKIGSDHLIPIIKFISPNNLNKTEFVNLKNGCVIKATHGSGWVDIFREEDLKNVNWDSKLEEYRHWLSMNYYNYSFEPQYKKIEPSIIIEELLLIENTLPIDIKVHCFNGEPIFIHLATDREGKSARAFYDKNWIRLDFQWSPVDKKGKLKKGVSPDVEKPDNLDEILDIASKLSKDFIYVRVDLYNVGGKVYFGELTFHPGSGFDVFFPEEFDIFYGSLLDISNRSILKNNFY